MVDSDPYLAPTERPNQRSSYSAEVRIPLDATTWPNSEKHELAPRRPEESTRRVRLNDRVVEVSAGRPSTTRTRTQWLREGASVLLLWGAAYVGMHTYESEDLLSARRVLQESNGTSTERPVGEIVLDFLGIIVLICLSGLFSGLTLGLMSLDKIGLEIVIGGEPDSKDAKNARVIQPIREHGNLLLCTLLFGNTLVNAALSVLLASYTGGIVGTIVSTFLIFIFGELMPQATCSRHALYIGARTVWLVRIFMVLFYIIVKPISMVLDCIFNEEIGAIYSSSQLSMLLDIHVKHETLDAEQAKMMGGAMDYKAKQVESVMTPKENIFMLSADTVLDFPTISKIFHTGYSRIPVYTGTRNNIVGLLFTKDLIVIDPEESTRVSAIIEFFHRPVNWLWPDTKLSEALKLFKSGRGHLALVRRVVETEDTDPFYEFCGLITLEDIIEEIIGDEIVDETDCFVQVEDDTTRVDRSTFDFARLRLLDPRRQSELTDNEVSVVCAHLSKNVPEFKDLEPEQLSKVVRSTPVLEFSKGEMLYKRDKPITHFTLCLSGKVQVTAGSEGFLSEVGPWSCLGRQALKFNDGEFHSDFTATVLSDNLRCIRLSKRQVDVAKKPPAVDETKPEHIGSKVAASEEKPDDKVNGGPHEG